MPETTEEVTRTEVRPGLVMVKRRTRKEDGRYLIYFEFERPAAPAREGAAEDA
jgi:hypothetical protein